LKTTGAVHSINCRHADGDAVSHRFGLFSPKRPNRERDNLVIEQTRIVNQIKAILIRFGIRSSRPKLRKAEEQLRDLRTAEGSPLPENTRAELCRHLIRLRMVREQIRAIEKELLQKLKEFEPAMRSVSPPSRRILPSCSRPSRTLGTSGRDGRMAPPAEQENWTRKRWLTKRKE
jgi:hypothetical protein